MGVREEMAEPEQFRYNSGGIGSLANSSNLILCVLVIREREQANKRAKVFVNSLETVSFYL